MASAATPGAPRASAAAARAASTPRDLSSSTLSQQDVKDSLGPTARDYWLPDGIARSCASCRRRFTSFRRKHHCRRCGNVFCRRCAAQYRALDSYLSPVGGVVQNRGGVPQRLCQSCCQRFDTARNVAAQGQRTQLRKLEQQPADEAGRNSDLIEMFGGSLGRDRGNSRAGNLREHFEQDVAPSGINIIPSLSIETVGPFDVGELISGDADLDESSDSDADGGAHTPLSQSSSGGGTSTRSDLSSPALSSSSSSMSVSTGNELSGSPQASKQSPASPSASLSSTARRGSSSGRRIEDGSLSQRSTPIPTLSTARDAVLGATAGSPRAFLTGARRVLLKSQKDSLYASKRRATTSIKQLLLRIAHFEEKLQRANAKADLASAAADREGAGPKEKRAESAAAAEVSQLETVVAALLQQRDSLQLEIQFPRCMHWMLRVKAEEEGNPALYIGIRDFNVEKLAADFGMRLGNACMDGVDAVMEVTGVEAAVSVYRLKLTGPSLLGKALNQLISSRRISLEIQGSWVLPLVHARSSNNIGGGGDSFGTNGGFSGGGGGSSVQAGIGNGSRRWRRPKWRVVKSKAVFKLKLVKTVSGNATLKLPSKLVNWILNSILPGIISKAIVDALPDCIAPLLHSGSNAARITGSVSVVGEISNAAWRAPLVKSERARRLLQITLEEAHLLEEICKAPERGRAVGLKPGVSCYSLLKWRLSLASFSIEELEPIFWALQYGMSLPGSVAKDFVMHDRWAMDLLSTVCDLAQKPVTLSVQMHAPLMCEMSIWEGITVASKVYLDAKREELRKSAEVAQTASTSSASDGRDGRDDTSASKNTPTPLQAANPGWDEHESLTVRALEKSVSELQQLLGMALDLVKGASLTISALTAGGDGGVVGVRLDDLDAEVLVPRKNIDALTGPLDLDIHLDPSWTLFHPGPGDNEFTIKILPIPDSAWEAHVGDPENGVEGDDTEAEEYFDQDAAIEVVVGAARIDLFPSFSFDTLRPARTRRRINKSSEKETIPIAIKEESRAVPKKKKLPTRGGLRVRAHSLRITLLLKLVLEAIRVASDEASDRSRAEAKKLARAIRKGSAVELDEASPSQEAGSGRRRSSRRASSTASLIAETALLEALNVADVLLPYIEDSDRELHFQLNGLNISVSETGVVRLSSTDVANVSEGERAEGQAGGGEGKEVDDAGARRDRAASVPLTWLTFRLRVMIRKFVGDIMALSGLD